MTQCAACPWRGDHPLVPDDLVEYARTDPDGFVCHTRCGPCPGPRLLFDAEQKAAAS